MRNPIQFDIEESLLEFKKLSSKQPTLSKQERVDYNTSRKSDHWLRLKKH